MEANNNNIPLIIDDQDVDLTPLMHSALNVVGINWNRRLLSYQSDDDFGTLTEIDEDETESDNLVDRWASDGYESDEECPICYNITVQEKFYQCKHTICAKCHDKCIRARHVNCALCRAPEHNN